MWGRSAFLFGDSQLLERLLSELFGYQHHKTVGALCYDVLDSDELDELDGYSIHGRLSGMRNEWLGFYGDLGYLRLESDLEKYSGNELTVGVLFKIGQFGIFADARRTDLEGKDSGVRSALTDVRAGVRYQFGEIKAE